MGLIKFVMLITSGGSSGTLTMGDEDILWGDETTTFND